VIELGRFVLSLLVAQAHLYPLNAPWAPWLAWMSVFGFYTLSGYLMTRVLNERYGFGWSGTIAFAANRVLRLWPAYFVVVAFSLVLLSHIAKSPLYAVLRLPETRWDWLVNFTVIGITGFDIQHMAARPVLAPNSWSLSVELVAYVLLALGFAKSSRRLWLLACLGALALAGSTGYCLAARTILHGPYCFQNRCWVVQAGFIPFAIGGLIFFHQRSLKLLAERHRVGMALVFALTIAAIGLIEPLPYTLAPFVLVISREVSTRSTEFLGGGFVSPLHIALGHRVASGQRAGPIAR
jgi:peptidoglycan/LPS O-acetylase OafA/YrhL